MTAGFGDNVRIVSTPATDALGLSGKLGVVHGFTTPSATGVEVIGHNEDYALNVYFEDRAEGFWFADDLVEFVDHAPGTEFTVGSVKLIRREDGEWVEPSDSRPTPRGRPWWKFW
jgi:hypothetical protein